MSIKLKRQLVTFIGTLLFLSGLGALIMSPYWVWSQPEGGSGVNNPTWVYQLNVNDEYTLPTVDGTNAQILTTNGSGVVSWSNNAGSGAPTDATYITQTADATLSAEQALSTLSTGLMKVTTGTGEITTATAGSDYVATESDPNALLTAGTDNVKDTHLDWGTGANQISAVDLPIADSGAIITGTEVETALQENRTAINLNTSKTTESTTVGDTATLDLTLSTYDITGAVLPGGVDHDSLLNFASNEHFTQANITATGTIASGVWNGTTIAIANGGTGQTTAQAAIDALTAVSGATNEHVLTKDTGTGNAIWKAAAGGGGGVSIGDSIGSGTAGSVLFVDGSANLGQDNANLFWDTGNARLGLGIATPASNLHLYQNSPTANQVLFQVGTSAHATKFSVDEDGDVYIRGDYTSQGDMDFKTISAADIRFYPGGTYGGRFRNGTGYLSLGGSVPVRQLDIDDNSGNPQLRLTHTATSKFVDFFLDTNHDLLIQPSSTGQVKFQSTTDQADFFQVLDADGGTSVLNVDSLNERVGIGTDTPDTELHVAGQIKQAIVSSNVSNPPTDAELDALYTSPATMGDGWTVYIDDSDSDNFYQVIASGSLWMIFTAAKAL